MLYLSLHKLDYANIVKTIKEGNFILMIPVLIISILVYIVRVLRWNLLFRQINQDIPKLDLTRALCIGYLVNFAVPRLGEISRCAVLKKSNSVPFNLSLSTVIFERSIDIIALFIISVLALILEYYTDSQLLKSYINMDMLPKGHIILFILFFLLILLVGIFIIFRSKSKIRNWLQGLWSSIKILSKLKGLFQFFLYTIFIWFCYYLMTYLWFFTFSESSKLSAYMAFQIMIVGSFARSMPLQGGAAGAYHYGVSQALISLGVSSLTANALAIVIHGFQTIFTFIVGGIAYITFVYRSKV